MLMQANEATRAVLAARSIASSFGLAADDAVVLHDSNKLTLRLLPGDVVARVAPRDQQNAAFELEVAGGLAAAGSPVAAPDPRVEPRVHERDGFVVTLWTYHEPAPAGEIAPAGYARALGRLHAGMRALDVSTPHFTDRVAEARRLVADPDLTPALADDDRDLLRDILHRPIGGADQILHGEPHPGNLLMTRAGPLFVDFETCCRGPVEFDLAHAPDEVADHYPGVDRALLRDCRSLMLAMISAWRWDPGDQLPNGHQLGREWLRDLRQRER
jgi:aminoglycoside phosphotransferase (APT) family kinase protein